MKPLQIMCAAFIVGVLSVPSASAICFYNGKMSATTTLAQEFADSHWVVHVKVVAADNHWSEEDDSWTIYHLQLLAAFKGNPPARIDMFTHRDSGGFYLDRGRDNDLGGEYLLLLNPISHEHTTPAAARNATEVNYSCGQSKAWDSVSTSEQHKLIALSQEHQARHPTSVSRKLQSGASMTGASGARVTASRTASRNGGE